MRIITFIICIFALTACGDHPPATQVKNHQSIFILIENGGTVAGDTQDEALNTALHVLQQLTKLSRRKATRNSQLYIVLSATPNRIAWSGSPQQLLTQAQDVKDMIIFKPSFSDLVMAFEQIETTINLTQPDTIKLYWIGPTIHVPFQASGDEIINVSVPQEVPEKLALSRFSDRLSVLKIMRVHPDQDRVLQAYLASLSILKRARDGDLEFSLLGEAQTKSRLKTLL